MICYKDKTFCDGNGGKCIHFEKCDRALTESVIAKADACGLWISRFAEPSKIKCYEESPERKEKAFSSGSMEDKEQNSAG